MSTHPRLLHTVLDTDDVRGTADFWRELLDLRFRPGDEEPTEGEDWLVLTDHDGNRQLAFQLTDDLQRSTWPEPGVPMQLHLDLTVSSVAELDEQHERVLALGGELRYDRTHTPEEPLRAYADPAGHVFCIFVA
ncbi:VOC family protein [Nocardioides currus]|uniref:Glyoxalase n=1 Tax=Nocardioides currus TaxID=2133958 RepID=A0A2R7YUQ4_9ACTN|nr:VOC family protein [Nocardioides currus]PUA79619.1 glyoxalase [Nocardioides currus]